MACGAVLSGTPGLTHLRTMGFPGCPDPSWVWALLSGCRAPSMLLRESHSFCLPSHPGLLPRLAAGFTVMFVLNLTVFVRESSFQGEGQVRQQGRERGSPAQPHLLAQQPLQGSLCLVSPHTPSPAMHNLPAAGTGTGVRSTWQVNKPRRQGRLLGYQPVSLLTSWAVLGVNLSSSLVLSLKH